MTEPNENGNYTEQEWDRLPIAQRMRLCASGEYEIYPPDMIDAATRIEKLEVALRKIKDLHDQSGPEDEQVIMTRDDMTYFIVCEALGGEGR